MTREKIIKQLQAMADDWPDDLWLFAGEGVLCLMEKKDGERVVRDGSREPAFDADAVIETFHGIECDGGGW